MSTTRWIIETKCEHGRQHEHRTKDDGWCSGPTRLVVDPDNLPPEAWRVLNSASAFGHPGGSVALWNDLTAAFLSDPEQAQQ